jgi:hypothetical protein
MRQQRQILFGKLTKSRTHTNTLAHHSPHVHLALTSHSHAQTLTSLHSHYYRFFFLARDFPKNTSLSENHDPQSKYQIYKRQEIEARILERLRRQEREFMVCRMFHPTNGRVNFLPFTPTVPFEKMPDRETLLKILALENELRLTQETQEEYCASNYTTAVTLNVQTKAVRQYGYSDAWIIPSAMYYYKDDKELMSIPHYVKYNRSRQGRLVCGDTVPEIPLSTINGCATSLRELMKLHAAAPVVLVAGSYT